MAQLCCQPASFPARPPAQHQGLGDTPDSNCAVRSRRLAQCHEPRSAQDPGPSVIWRSSGPRQRPPPPGSREPCFHSLCSVAQHLQTERAPSTPYSTRSCPGASPSRPGPFLHPTGHTPSLLRGSVSLLGRPGQPAPACWVPASHSPALGASGPACRPHTHLLSLYSSVSSRGRPGGGCHPVA